MDTTPQRTSLEALQVYPFGALEVEFINWRNEDGTHPRGRLLGLFTTDVDEYAIVDFGDEDRGTHQLEARYCIPCLKPFSALCTPLEGGEVPAVSVMNSPPPLRGRITCAKYVEHETMGPVVLGYINPNHQYEEAIFLSAFLNGHMMQAQVEVLRRLHFAVGLSDTDFIAK